ncbi:HTH-type transcriptional activator RhaS [Porphyromonas gingivalis]
MDTGCIPPTVNFFQYTSSFERIHRTGVYNPSEDSAGNKLFLVLRRLHISRNFYSNLLINSDLCVMSNTVITKYLFNSSLAIGLEVKSLDFLWEEASLTNRIHRVDFYHLIWVEEGELYLMIDFEELCLRNSEAVLIAPGQVCRFNLQSHPKAYSVIFVPEFLGEATSDSQLLHQILRTDPTGGKIISLQSLPISNLIQQLIRELACNSKDEYQLVVVRSCLRILLAEVARRLPKEVGYSNELARRFFDEVERRHHQWYNVKDYLPLLSTQEKLLTQSVRLAVGMTPKTYIDHRRVLEIKRLLAYSSLSVKEIAFSLGFEEPTNFNKFFRKHAGITPNEFRLLHN